MTKRSQHKIKLPGLLAEVANVVGIDAAVRLAAAVGGTYVYIPARVNGNHWLVETVGPKPAQEIVGFLAHGTRGLNVYIPKLPRSVAVHVLTSLGKSARAIAHQLHITQRTVHSHRRKQPALTVADLAPVGAVRRHVFKQLGISAEDIHHYGANLS